MRRTDWLVACFNGASDRRPGSHFGPRYIPRGTRGIEIQVVFGDNGRFAAREPGLRVSSSSLAMRATPFGQSGERRETGSAIRGASRQPLQAYLAGVLEHKGAVPPSLSRG